MSRNGRQIIQRQNKVTEKSRYTFRVTADNYDYICSEAKKEGMSLAAMINRIILERRRNVPRGTFAAS